MEQNFTRCLALVLEHEGGYVNHPADPGGETNYGITVKVARAEGYTGSMKNIPMSLVKKIYKEKYWDALNCDNHPPGLDYCIFDYAVNSGPARVRRVLAELAPKYDVPNLIQAICNERMVFLRNLKTWKTFGKGWTSRVTSVRKDALAMVGTEILAPLPVPTPKPQIKSKTNWSALGALGAAMLAAISHPAVQAFFLLLVAGFVGWIIYERVKRNANDSRLSAALRPYIEVDPVEPDLGGSDFDLQDVGGFGHSEDEGEVRSPGDDDAGGDANKDGGQ